MQQNKEAVATADCDVQQKDDVANERSHFVQLDAADKGRCASESGADRKAAFEFFRSLELCN